MDVKQDAAVIFQVAVIRCRCGDPAQHPGAPCPQGERVVTETQEIPTPPKGLLGRLRR